MRRPLVAAMPREVRVRPVRPNLGLEAAYQRRLDAAIAEMHRSVKRAVLAAYRDSPPEMASDESPAVALRAMMRRLAREWNARFAELAAGEGRKFGREAAASTDRSFAAALRQAGFTVKFVVTPAVNDVIQATVGAQVALIKSIPAEYFTQIEGAVMRSVQAGHDAGMLSANLQAEYGVTARRAAIIARDQNTKANASIVRVRQRELGITHARWQHSAGGKVPRPEHVAFSGKEYDIEKGAFLEGKWTWPGVEINCRCVAISIIRGAE